MGRMNGIPYGKSGLTFGLQNSLTGLSQDSI